MSFFSVSFFSFESLEKINKLFTDLGSVRIVKKTVTSDLKMLPEAADHSFPLYGPPSRQITYIYFFLKHLSGPESQILESDWLIPRARAVRIFSYGPRVTPRTDRS